ncbi:MAG TPA: cytochrome c-type biogenesis CcmF C-terminal domain-containing protein, partial [Herpetosiphonaceae bacterium]
TNAPFGLLLLLTMAVGPLLGWQRSKYGSVTRLLTWPALLTGVVLFAALLLNITYPVALLFIGAAVFAVTTNVAVIRRIWRAGPLKLGGYVSHVGVGLLFVGVVGTSLYKQTASLQLIQDQPQTVFGRQFTFRGVGIPQSDPLKRRAVQIEVTDPQTGSTWLAEAPHYTFAKTGALVSHPAIESGLWSDLYLAPSQYDPPAQASPGVLYMLKGRAQQVGGYTLEFKQFELPNREAMLRGEALPVVAAVIDITAPDGTTTTVKPTLAFDANQQPISASVTLPGGATATLMRVDPRNQMVTVQVGNVDLSQVKPEAMQGRVFVEVSHEPGIKFAWAGFIIGVLGGVLAMLRRWREGRVPALSTLLPERGPMPQPQRPILQPGVAQIGIESEAR